jgi:hypothetical protein
MQRAPLQRGGGGRGQDFGVNRFGVNSLVSPHLGGGGGGEGMDEPVNHGSGNNGEIPILSSTMLYAPTSVGGCTS